MTEKRVIYPKFRLKEKRINKKKKGKSENKEKNFLIWSFPNLVALLIFPLFNFVLIILIILIT